MWHHRCPVKEKGHNSKRNHWISKCLCLLPTPLKVSETLKNILCNMKNDDVTNIIKNDKVILEFVKTLLEMWSWQRYTVHAYIKCKLREVGRLLLALKEESAFKKHSMADVLRPQKFTAIVSVIQKITGLDTFFKEIASKSPSTLNTDRP